MDDDDPQIEVNSEQYPVAKIEEKKVSLSGTVQTCAILSLLIDKAANICISCLQIFEEWW